MMHDAVVDAVHAAGDPEEVAQHVRCQQIQCSPHCTHRSPLRGSQLSQCGLPRLRALKMTHVGSMFDEDRHTYGYVLGAHRGCCGRARGARCSAARG